MICSRCKKDKSPDEFHRHRRKKSGLYSQCKSCAAGLNKVWRSKNADKIRLTGKKWNAANYDKVQAQRRKYRESHREELCEKQKARYRIDPQPYKDRMREWELAHPEKVREHARKMNESRKAIKLQWQKDHPEISREKERRRRAKKQSVLTIRFTQEQLNSRLSMFGNKCWICGADAESVDHVKPIAAGGGHLLANIRPACGKCNSGKGAKWPLDISKSAFGVVLGIV